MSRFNLSERIKKENAKEKEQIRLKKKHQIDQENVVVVEKSNTYKFTIKTIISFIKLIATVTLLILAVIGLTTLVYPTLRQEFLTIFLDVFDQFKNFIKIESINDYVFNRINLNIENHHSLQQNLNDKSLHIKQSKHQKISIDR